MNMKQRFQAVVFDLDGTLLDTIGDISDSMNTVLKARGFPLHSESEFKMYIGDGIEEFAERSIPAEMRSEVLIRELVREMRAIYRERWQCNTKPYPGVPELLDWLTVQEIKLAVLSNKPHDFTNEMIRALLSRWKFNPVMGACPEIPRKPDPAGAFKLLERVGLQGDNVLYLGDSENDMLTANASGMHAVGVSWGFRSEACLQEAGAEWVIGHPCDLKDIIQSGTKNSFKAADC
ncbi:HAD family hydrolase [bacterium]|nr:HAD family hydrolase [candidate division CSSED10-310 bacterium]